MAQRWLAFALTFVFAAAPVAGEICEARCAEHLGHAMVHEGVASHHHHTSDSAPDPAEHHHPPVASTSTNQRLILNALPRGCVELDAVVTESREVLRRPMAGAFATTISVPVTISLPWRSSQTTRQHRPAVPARSISPLRI
jgi:hypothetical protein